MYIQTSILIIHNNVNIFAYWLDVVSLIGLSGTLLSLCLLNMYIYVIMCTILYVCIYLCMYLCIQYIFMYVCVCVCMYMYVCVYVCVSYGAISHKQPSQHVPCLYILHVFYFVLSLFLSLEQYKCEFILHALLLGKWNRIGM